MEGKVQLEQGRGLVLILFCTLFYHVFFWNDFPILFMIFSFQFNDFPYFIHDFLYFIYDLPPILFMIFPTLLIIFVFFL